MAASKIRRATLKDVAQQAEVSAAAVSMVLNRAAGHERISDETRANILDAAKRLDYQPNVMAQALRRQHSMQIAFATPTIYHPFTPELIDSIGQALRARNYSLLLLDFTNTTGEEARETIARLKRGGIDGIIMHSMSRMLAPAVHGEMPVVYLDEKSVTPSVWFDAESGIRQLAVHFFDQGVRDVAYVGASEDNETFREREKGFFAAHAERDIPVGRERIFRVPPTTDGGIMAVEWLLSLADRPRAVITFTDNVAHAMLLRLLRENIRVPDEIAMASLDDVQMSSLMVPALTCAKVPAREMGTLAVDMIFRQLDGETLDITETLPVCVNVRDSSRCG